MPIEVRFEADRKLLHITVSGPWPTLAEILAERSRLLQAGFVRPDVVELVDARKVTRGIPNLSQMQGILKAIGKPPHKRALVVSSNVQYGAGKMAQLLDPSGLHVFRDESSALAWLFDTGNDEPVKFDRTRSGKIATVRQR
jgi:hypothetical protein